MTFDTTPEPEEGAMFTTITPKAAVGNGDLDGFAVECTCGLRFIVAFESSARREAHAHELWHAGER